jgi:2-methylaconitate cis-trans-isomerase PrpF
VRIHNTNTGMIIHAHFPLDEGQAAVDGDYAQIGVAGTGAPERLDFISPGGAITGKLLPTGNLVDTVEVPGLGKIEASLIDAGNSFAFVEAGVFGLTGTESPTEIDSRPGLLDAIETARNHMGVLMGLSATPEESRTKLPNQPKIAMVSPPQDAVTLTGETVKAADGDLTARIISSGNCHRALPLTGAIGTSVAARIEGTVANRFARQPRKPDQDIQLMQPSGVMTLKPVVTKGADGWTAERVGVYRTHRRLFDGYVYLPASKVPRMAAREAKLSTAAE